MEVISWNDIRNGILAMVLVIMPTVLLSIYLVPALQSYHLTGPDLWQLEKTNVPKTVIKPLHELRLKAFFFKFRLMGEVESKISNPVLYKKFEKKIESQISRINMPGIEYIFLSTLALIYGILWLATRKFFSKSEN